jgi:hypothetical protein
MMIDSESGEDEEEDEDDDEDEEGSDDYEPGMLAVGKCHDGSLIFVRMKRRMSMMMRMRREVTTMSLECWL